MTQVSGRALLAPGGSAMMPHIVWITRQRQTKPRWPVLKVKELWIFIWTGLFSSSETWQQQKYTRRQSPCCSSFYGKKAIFNRCQSRFSFISVFSLGLSDLILVHGHRKCSVLQARTMAGTHKNHICVICSCFASLSRNLASRYSSSASLLGLLTSIHLKQYTAAGLLTKPRGGGKYKIGHLNLRELIWKFYSLPLKRFMALAPDTISNFTESLSLFNLHTVSGHQWKSCQQFPQLDLRLKRAPLLPSGKPNTRMFCQMNPPVATFLNGLWKATCI